MGRPTKKTDEIIKRVIEGLSKGTPLTLICSEDGMPDPSTVRRWATDDEEFSRDFARARDAGWDTIALDALRIADTPQEGIEHTDTPEGPRIKRGDMLGHRKLQVETRLKLLAKWDKRYSDKITQEISGPDGAPIQSQAVSLDPAQEAALQQVIEDAKSRIR